MLFHAIDNTFANCLNQLVVVRVLREITHAGKEQMVLTGVCPFPFAREEFHLIEAVIRTEWKSTDTFQAP